MKTLLILYASRGGSTSEVAHYIHRVLHQQGVDASIFNADEFDGDIHDYDGVILGSPIYKGVWMTSLWRRIRHLQEQFKDKPVWAFSLCMRVLEPGGKDYAQHHYLPHTVLDKLNMRDYRFFAGRLAHLSLTQKTEFYETYDGNRGRQEGDYRDWGAIRAWALEIAKCFELSLTR